MAQNEREEARILREKAEVSVAGRYLERGLYDIPELASEQAKKLVHELQVHQIELEIQNEELRRIMLELEESHKHFSALFQQAPLGYLLLDEVGLIREVNETFCRMMGQPRSQVIGNPFVECMDGSGRDVFLARYRAFFRNPVDKRLEVLIRRERGPAFHADLKGALLTSALGRQQTNQQPRLLLAVTDITERKWAEEKRLQLERQMQQSQKLESLGVLAGGIAHDFNNLLAIILGNASLALDELPSNSAARDSLGAIEQTSLRAAELCRQMLAYSGKGRFVMENLGLSDLIDSMTTLLKASISKKAILNLNLHPTEPLPPLRGDPSQIRQVVMNLVVNASEALNDRAGAIAVSTGVMECSREYLAQVYGEENLREGDYVWLEVADTGCGMSAEVLQRMFEPFFTTKFTGRGLGLAAVLGIVRGHQGALKVESEPGGGTTFKVLFPAVEVGKTAVQREGISDASAWKKSGAILLVDDEESVRILGLRMLERLGFQALAACNGRQALDLFRERPGEIALVLMDLTMPELNGEDTLQELRQLDPRIPVVMSSGYAESEIIARFARQRLAGFLQKPYTMATLMDCLRGALSDGGPWSES
ncbi:MAG: ATP-binding protein [Candidatus Contendobacter sp.]